MAMAVVCIILLFAGVQSRLNRKRWAAQMRVIESLSEEETEPGQEVLSEIPAPVTVEEEPEAIERYDDGDVELI